MWPKMDKVNLRVEVDINLTEDSVKVIHAVENIFGHLEFKEETRHRIRSLVAHEKNTEALSKFGNLLRREHIRNAARKALFQGLKGNFITFCLNKQVAYAGHVSFCEPVAESPLGPIRVEIKCDNPKKLIDWLAPRTL